MKIKHLRTLHQKEPLGIDRKPYFSWQMDSDRRNTVQAAYRIQVTGNGENVWDTGKVFDRRQAFIPYEGESLSSGVAYQWTVTVWDNYGQVSTECSYFETALLRRQDWGANWIESTIPQKDPKPYTYGNQSPAVWFRKYFKISGPVVRARLYATAYGCYRAYINGKRMDDREFAPEHTVYREILYYQTYDVTDFLREGENECAFYVGDGWYRCPQSEPILQKGKEHWLPAVLFQLEIEYEDGSKERIVSDGSETCSTGVVAFSDLFLGEKQDARVRKCEQHPVVIRNYGFEQLKAQPMPPVRPVKLLPAVRAYQSPRGEWIVDFGQLLAGRARIYINVPKDREVVFEYFECTDQDGNYYNSMLADQRDIYVSDGVPCVYEAFFTYHGFRYIRVTGMDEVRREDFTAVFLTTEKENVGSFCCSDERLNRLYKNVRWSQAGNMLSIPTDCPSREKGGFTGDIQIYARTALWNEDVTPFLTSWLDNLRKDQTEDGVLPIVTPFNRTYERIMSGACAKFGDLKPEGVAGWSDAIVLVPYQMYCMTGNRFVLEDCYESMKCWCEYVIRRAEQKRGDASLPANIDRYLWNTGFHFGEWLIPSQKQEAEYGECLKSAWYTAPMFGYWSVKSFSRIGEILGREEAVKYKTSAEKMKKAIQDGLMKENGICRIVDDGGKKEVCEFMGAYVLAFAFGLVPEANKDRYANRLVELLEKNDYCLDTGFLATPYLLDVLCDIGRKDLAIKLLWQEKQPSWLFEVNHGATSIWESWYSMTEDDRPTITSYNHYAFGCVDDWIARNLAGIKEGSEGFSHIRIEPYTENPLTWCKRSFYSEYGEIYTYWTRDMLKVKIPCNTTATIIWKKKRYEVGSGEYEFD